MAAPGMQPNPYQQQPYGYPQQGNHQQQTGRNYQTGLASPGYPQYGQSYAQGLAGNAAYQDENDIYNVNIPSAFDRLKALRKPSKRPRPVMVNPNPKPGPKPSPKVHENLCIQAKKPIVEESLLTSCSRLVIKKMTSGCVRMACDSLLTTSLLQVVNRLVAS